MTMGVVTKLYESLISYINTARNNYDQYETAAKRKNRYADYKDTFERKGCRSRRITFFEGSSETAQLRGKEKFRVDTFIPIIVPLNRHIKKRSVAYQEIDSRFSFLCQLTTIDSGELTKKCKKIAEFYHEDINADEFKTECFHLIQYLKT